MVFKMATDQRSSGLVICIISILALGLDGVVSQYGGPAPGQLTCGTRLMSGIFQRPQLPLGYTLIATIPSGACRINVTEMAHSNNYLALKTTNGTYIINGNFAISWPGDFEAAGTKFLYHRQSGPLVEAISAPGPLTQPVDIMILYQHPNPGIKYEYTIQIPENEEDEQSPPEPRPPPHETARHHVAPSSHHARSNPAEAPPPEPLSPRNSVAEVDGNSIDSRRPDRVDVDRFPYGPGVLATESEKPSHVTQRHRRRKFVWQVSKYTSCSAQCAGVQMPILLCVREYNQAPSPSERRCGPRPSSANVGRPCGGPCPARWMPLSWGPCSATCGYALQTRQIQCRQDVAHHSLNVLVGDSLCTDSPLSTSQKCQQLDCPSPGDHDRDTQLKSNDLSPPSTGYSRSGSDSRPGLRNRSFRDRDETDRFSDAATPVIISRYANDTQGRRSAPANERGTDELSNEISSPEGSRGNGNTFRNTGNGHWKAGNAWIYSEWTQECSEECGKGVQTRSVRCADPSGCDERRRPLDSRACSSDRKCITQSSKWFTGPWSQCSNPCAINGKMTRDVVCVSYYRGQQKVNVGGCNQQSKPDADRPCPPSMLRGDCEPEWLVSDWSQCVGACGNTQQTRLVTCQSSSGGPEGSCKLSRPSNRRECVPSHCHLGGFTPKPPTDSDKDNENFVDETAVSGDCSDKIASCHLAVQARLCQYKYYANSCCASCRRAPSLS